MTPSTEQAVRKASEAVGGSAVKDFKRESATARLVGAGTFKIMHSRGRHEEAKRVTGTIVRMMNNGADEIAG